MSLQPLEGALERRIGLRLDRAMRVRLDRYANEAARASGLSLDDYSELIRADDAARQALVDRLVVPTTYFFRHPEQFEALLRMLPEWRDPITIWCAACSTGQEAYSLAMLLYESARPDWRIVASDISTEALERTAAGIYEPRELEGLGRERQHYLEPRGKNWQVTRRLRDRVTVVRQNLATDDPPREASGAVAVFCRNVLIYLGPEAQHTFLEGLGRLPLLQVLFVGATETLWGVTERFVPVTVEHAYAYRPAGRRLPAKVERRPAPRTAARPPLPKQQPQPQEGATTFIADGEAALAAGDPEGAVAAFRKACYLDSDDPFAYLHLALALESVGDSDARRAFAAARAALTARGSSVVESELKGFKAGELLRLIEHRLGPA